jgi:hypothetical protein
MTKATHNPMTFCVRLARTVYRIYTPYITVYLLKSLQEMPYIHQICTGSGQPYFVPLLYITLPCVNFARVGSYEGVSMHMHASS